MKKPIDFKIVKKLEGKLGRAGILSTDRTQLSVINASCSFEAASAEYVSALCSYSVFNNAPHDRTLIFILYAVFIDKNIRRIA